MNQQKRPFYSGLIHGIPIGLGYLAVSFTFGIIAVSSGLSVFQSVLISLTNLTSAGQFAGLGIITAGSSYLEMAAVQLVINLRYCLMSCSLSQKLDHKMPLFHRFLMAYVVTDEIFGVSTPEKIIKHIKKRLVPGSILLLHDRMPDSDRLLVQVLDFIEKEGYTVVALDRLIKDMTK